PNARSTRAAPACPRRARPAAPPAVPRALATAPECRARSRDQGRRRWKVLTALVDGDREHAQVAATPTEPNDLVQTALDAGRLLARQPAAGHQERAFAQHAGVIELLVRLRKDRALKPAGPIRQDDPR